jgi:HKD family nuclease
MGKQGLVPSSRWPNACSVLEEILTGADRVQAAVAFVTTSGVELVEPLRVAHPEVAIEVVARGAPITEPHALVRLAELDVSVSVVVGSRATHFHPKLWLVHSGESLWVLSGSGNLTAGGLRDNAEQFEVLCTPSDEHATISAHEQRYRELTAAALSLQQVREMPYWRLWGQQIARRRALADEQQALDDALWRTADTDFAVEVLYADLLALYERTKKEVRIPTGDGGTRPYVASYFKRAIDHSHGSGGPVPVVARMVKSPTEGFHHLAQARRPDLMVETLVVDASKPYHHLFSAAAIAQAQRNLDNYRAKFES